MPQRITLSALRRARCVLTTSFLAYLRHARPYAGPDDAAEAQLLDELITRQQGLAQEVTDLLEELGAEPETCDFPASFTDAHDLSVRYCLRRAAESYPAGVERLRELRDEQNDARADDLFAKLIVETAAISETLEQAESPKPAATG